MAPIEVEFRGSWREREKIFSTGRGEQTGFQLGLEDGRTTVALDDVILNVRITSESNPGQNRQGPPFVERESVCLIDKSSRLTKKDPADGQRVVAQMDIPPNGDPIEVRARGEIIATVRHIQ